MSSYQLNISEWQRQHSIYVTQQKKYTYELGFAAFYLNRTNRSGIIKGGVIGGKEQSGKWTMGVRFHQEQLSERIREIAGRKSQIRLYNKDIHVIKIVVTQQFQECIFLSTRDIIS